MIWVASGLSTGPCCIGENCEVDCGHRTPWRPVPCFVARRSVNDRRTMAHLRDTARSVAIWMNPLLRERLISPCPGDGSFAVNARESKWHRESRRCTIVIHDKAAPSSSGSARGSDSPGERQRTRRIGTGNVACAATVRKNRRRGRRAAVAPRRRSPCCLDDNNQRQRDSGTT